MGLREFANRFWHTVLGIVTAGVGVALLYFEYKEGVAHAHTTHIFLYTAIFGVGMLMIAPALVGGAANKLVLLVLDAKKGGARWTDPPADPPKSDAGKPG